VNATDRTEVWKKLLTVSWALVGLGILVAGALWILGRVAGALTPFVLALVVVFLLRGWVTRLEGLGLKRSAAVGVCYLVSAVVLSVIGLFIVPPMAAEIRDFVNDFPRYYDAAYDLWTTVETEYLTVELPNWVREAAEASRESVVTWATGFSKNLAQGVVSVGGQVVGFFVNVFLALALAFFVLRDLPTLKSEVFSLPGPRRRDETLALAAEVTVVLEGFIRGQLMIASLVGLLTGVGLWVLGVPYALVIGIIAGVANLVPYLGPIVGGVVAAISAAFVSPQLVLWAIVWIVVVQQAEGLFLQPRIMSDQVHLHPALVILSLLVGATLFGLIGMLLAVPVAAVAKVLFVHFYEKWTESPISSEHGALFRKRRAPDSDETCTPTPPKDTGPRERGDRDSLADEVSDETGTTTKKETE